MREKRTELGLSIEKLSEKADVSVSFISRVEWEQISDIKLRNLEKLSSALNIPIETFFADRNLAGLQTQKLIQFLKQLNDDNREQLCKTILKLIELSKYSTN